MTPFSLECLVIVVLYHIIVVLLYDICFILRKVCVALKIIYTLSFSLIMLIMWFCVGHFISCNIPLCCLFSIYFISNPRNISRLTYRILNHSTSSLPEAMNLVIPFPDSMLIGRIINFFLQSRSR